MKERKKVPSGDRMNLEEEGSTQAGDASEQA
jgi:hypothetical protein